MLVRLVLLQWSSPCKNWGNGLSLISGKKFLVNFSFRFIVVSLLCLANFIFLGYYSHFSFAIPTFLLFLSLSLALCYDICFSGRGLIALYFVENEWNLFAMGKNDIYFSFLGGGREFDRWFTSSEH